MNTKGGVPDAWDDDWISKADSKSPQESSQGSTKVSKAERRAKQAELNRKLWEEADTPENPYYINSRNEVPLKTEFKPAMKVLSRKPAPKLVTRTDPVSGLEQLTIEDDDDDDDEATTKTTMTMEQRQQKAQREREEKQRKYEEVRERLFGAGTSGAMSGTRSPGQVTPPKAGSSGEGKTRGRSKGGREARPAPSADGKTPQLYDPSYAAKPDSGFVHKRDAQAPASGRDTPGEEQLIRNPRGPDGSGRGGFGFAARGRKVA
ncbi:SUZ domain [Lasallia pustulata]|uniref:SUZ domain n=1 Tax=Lasallia pustulata TaxID=136370 RepID=A0A1W5D3F1_9LECA|nr:SUZ domain [Lasallia pustulata]